MEPVWRFVIWMTISLVGIFALVTTITNPFMISFVISIIIAFLGVKNE